MKRSIWYEVCHNGNLERFWNINRTRNKIKVYIKNRECVICDRILEIKNKKYSRERIFRNDITYKLNDLKIYPFICVNNYKIRKERQAMLSIYHSGI